MNGTTQVGLTHVGDGDVLMLNFYALDPLDLIELPADILRDGGHALREDITTRYTARTVDLPVVELDGHAGRLRSITNQSTKDTQ
jgi:hypothetical protein